MLLTNNNTGLLIIMGQNENAFKDNVLDEYLIRNSCTYSH